MAVRLERLAAVPTGDHALEYALRSTDCSCDGGKPLSSLDLFVKLLSYEGLLPTGMVFFFVPDLSLYLISPR